MPAVSKKHASEAEGTRQVRANHHVSEVANMKWRVGVAGSVLHHHLRRGRAGPVSWADATTEALCFRDRRGWPGQATRLVPLLHLGVTELVTQLEDSAARRARKAGQAEHRERRCKEPLDSTEPHRIASLNTSARFTKMFKYGPTPAHLQADDAPPEC